MQLPIDFINQMKNLKGLDFDAFISQYDKPAIKGLRINTLKCDKSIIDIMGLSLEPITYENAFYLPYDCRLGNHPFHHAGLFYLQEPSAMLPVSSITLPDDAIILDLCSAPGGKSTQIATKIPNGVLVSNEAVPDRARILRENIIRFGIKNCIITSNQPTTIAKELPNTFDYVFVDAPCSGEGMFRKEEIAIKEWHSQLPITNSIRQLDILSYAKQCVKPNGYLIYSTCTFNKLENEDVVSQFLRDNDNFKLIEVNQCCKSVTREGIDLPMARRFEPHLAKGEGQFFAVMQKDDSDMATKIYLPKTQISSVEANIVKNFLYKNTTLTDYKLHKLKNEVYITTKDLINTKRLNCFHFGVLVGTIEKSRLIPSHNLFTAYGDTFIHSIDLPLDSALLSQYLHGDTLVVDTDFDGIVAVKCLGHTIGGGKIVGNQLKNYYPKSLRRQ